MLMLFGALSTKIVKAEAVKGVVRVITGNMALFFIPVSVGIITAFDLVSANIMVFLIVPISTTIMIIVVVGLLQQYLERGSDKNIDSDDTDN